MPENRKSHQNLLQKVLQHPNQCRFFLKNESFVSDSIERIPVSLNLFRNFSGSTLKIKKSKIPMVFVLPGTASAIWTKESKVQDRQKSFVSKSTKMSCISIPHRGSNLFACHQQMKREKESLNFKSFIHE